MTDRGSSSSSTAVECPVFVMYSPGLASITRTPSAFARVQVFPFSQRRFAADLDRLAARLMALAPTLTTNGRTWDLLTFPSPAAFSELVSVDLVDAIADIEQADRECPVPDPHRGWRCGCVNRRMVGVGVGAVHGWLSVDMAAGISRLIGRLGVMMVVVG